MMNFEFGMGNAASGLSELEAVGAIGAYAPEGRRKAEVGIRISEFGSGKVEKIEKCKVSG